LRSPFRALLVVLLASFRSFPPTPPLGPFSFLALLLAFFFFRFLWFLPECQRRMLFAPQTFESRRCAPRGRFPDSPARVFFLDGVPSGLFFPLACCFLCEPPQFFVRLTLSSFVLSFFPSLDPNLARAGLPSSKRSLLPLENSRTVPPLEGLLFPFSFFFFPFLFVGRVLSRKAHQIFC